MPDSLRGQFLVSARHLRDPNFHKTVVLLVEHAADNGAMGLVVNRPSGVSVAQALSQHFELPETEDVVFVGGPVEDSALFMLHNAGDLDAAELPVIPGLYVGSSAEVFEDVVRRAADGDDGVKYRIYSGCAGWAPGQLEGELDRGDWHVLPATDDAVYHADPYRVWEIALAEYRREHPLAPGLSGNPEWN